MIVLIKKPELGGNYRNFLAGIFYEYWNVVTNVGNLNCILDTRSCYVHEYANTIKYYGVATMWVSGLEQNLSLRNFWDSNFPLERKFLDHVDKK